MLKIPLFIVILLGYRSPSSLVYAALRYYGDGHCCKNLATAESYMRTLMVITTFLSHHWVKVLNIFLNLIYPMDKIVQSSGLEREAKGNC